VPKSLIRRIALIIGAAALLFGVVAPAAMAATPAAAKAVPSNSAPAVVPAATPAAAPAGCSAGNVCFWNNINYNDGPGELSGTNASWFGFSHSSCPGGSWADCVSSIYNDGNSCTARLWYLTNFGSPSFTVARGTGYTNLTQLGTGISGVSWNDNIESNDWVC
jgi:hypothetical protein